MLMHSADSASRRLLAAMGLPSDRCTGMTIDLRPGLVACVMVEYALTEEAIQALQDSVPQMAIKVKPAVIASPGASRGHARHGDYRG